MPSDFSDDTIDSEIENCAVQMYSAEIFISATGVFVAEDEPEARQMNAQAKETALTIPQDEVFTDRDFTDPLLGNLTFATTFTYWTLLENIPLVDQGPVEAFLGSDRDGGVPRRYRLFSGHVMIGATVYLKADRRSKAESTFGGLDQTTFEFSTNGNGTALLGLSELKGICFRERFTCHILDQNKLTHRGACARYVGPDGGGEA